MHFKNPSMMLVFGINAVKWVDHFDRDLKRMRGRDRERERERERESIENQILCLHLLTHYYPFNSFKLHAILTNSNERMLGRDKWFGNGLIKCLDGYPRINGFCSRSWEISSYHNVQYIRHLNSISKHNFLCVNLTRLLPKALFFLEYN